MRRAATIVGVLALAAAVAAAVVWTLLLRDTAAPATIDDALARYRAAAAAGDTPVPPGVYVYRTTGSESISALGGTTHRYPTRSTITVTKHPCGMTLRWDALTTRTTEWTVCTGDDGTQTLAGWRERHVFFGQNDETTWLCTGSAWLVAADSVISPGTHRCDGGDATQTGTVEVLGTAQVVVGGSAIDAVRLRLTARERGDARGPLVEERWLEPGSGLPLRLRYRVRTRNASPIGDVTFTETYDLRLASLRPRT